VQWNEKEHLQTQSAAHNEACHAMYKIAFVLMGLPF